MYHVFFIHSLVEGHLGCFQVLAFMSNAAMNIVEYMSLWCKCESLDVCSRVVFLGLEVDLSQFTDKSPYLFPYQNVK